MKQYKTVEGYNMNVYSNAERKEFDKIINADVSPVGKNIPQYTPVDNLEYFILSETPLTEKTKLGYEMFQAVLKIKGKTYSYKYNIMNYHEKTYKFVRALYLKNS